MFSLRRNHTSADELLGSQLYDQSTFYDAFLYDLKSCNKELIIESPFITSKRIVMLLPILRRLTKRDVKIVINTRSPGEHDGIYQTQAEAAVGVLQELGVTVLYTGGHHRKLAVIDRAIVWEGSLNILSQNDSCEIMRRISSKSLAQQLIRFIHIEEYLT
jgi:hypothetical protein